MWRVFAVFCALLLCAAVSAGAAEIMSPRAFTDAFAAAARAALPSAQVVVKDDLNVETRPLGGQATVSDLHNAYNRYRSDPEHLQQIMQGYVATLVETTQATATIDRSHIVPVLKNTAWIENTRKVLAALPPDKAREPLTEPFNGKLTVVYVEDHVHSVRYLTTRDDVGDRAKLHDLALANLGHLLGKMEMRGATDGLWLISAGGNYEASLLLAGGIWSSGQIKVDGDIVAAVPAKRMRSLSLVRATPRVSHDCAKSLPISPVVLTLSPRRCSSIAAASSSNSMTNKQIVAQSTAVADPPFRALSTKEATAMASVNYQLYEQAMRLRK